MKGLLRATWLLLAAATLAGGCATNTMTGRTQMSLVSNESVSRQSLSYYSAMVSEYDKKQKVIESGPVKERIDRITNRLILQPLVEVDLAAKDDPAYGTARGFTGIETGLRLRYEVTRRFAPYVGVVHERALGDTADLRRAEGEPTRDTRVVAGVRIWF